MEKASIVYVHYAMNGERSQIMRYSLNSLFNSIDYNFHEIIVVDNGGDFKDSEFLMENCQMGKIACYIKNRRNMHFGYARNQGLKIATSDWIAVSDNDIEFQKGWLEECQDFLKNNKGKYLATPIKADRLNGYLRKDRWKGEIGGWRLNERAGSNIWLMRRRDFKHIGYFERHRIAGSLWTDKYVRKGYLMAVMPQPKAKDLGFRKGYNIKQEIEKSEL